MIEKEREIESSFYDQDLHRVPARTYVSGCSLINFAIDVITKGYDSDSKIKGRDNESGTGKDKRIER